MPHGPIPISPPVMAIARTLHDAGHDVWCVGGAIRDYLLHETIGEYDLATSATPDQVRALFRRTVPIGIEHGTVAVLDDDRKPHEVTTFRRDVRTDGRHAEVEFGASLEEDLARRDLTINAIAYHPLREQWCDPYEGERDLRAGVVRAVGDPAVRFREDYLRILRAVRFASRFAFTIDDATWRAAVAQGPSLARLSAERVRDEWTKSIRTARSLPELLERWRAVGAVDVWLPELARPGEEWEAAVAAADRLPRDPVLVTARLSVRPEETLRRLRCSNADIARGAAIAHHLDSVPTSRDPEAIRRWLARVGTAADDLITLHEANGGDAALRAAVDAVRRDAPPLTVADLALSGTDLIELGVPEGPLVGRTLRALLDRVLAHPDRNTRRDLEAMARELMEDRGR